MPQTINVEINGTTYAMPAHFRASQTLADRIGDPLQITLETHRLGNINLSINQVIDAIHVGITLAGADISRDELANHMWQKGIITFLPIVGRYIAAMVHGGPDKLPSKPEKEKHGKKKP